MRTIIICTSDIPGFDTSDTATVQNITSSSVTLSWPTPKNITTGLDSHYYYIVWLHSDGVIFNVISRVPQVSDLQRLQFEITGLASNTTYSVYVEPYRQQGAKHESGAALGVITFTTSRIGKLHVFKHIHHNDNQCLIYIHIHTYIHTYIYTHTDTHTRTRTRTRTRTHTHTHTHTHIQTHTQTHARTRTHARARACMHTFDYKVKKV